MHIDKAHLKSLTILMQQVINNLDLIFQSNYSPPEHYCSLLLCSCGTAISLQSETPRARCIVRSVNACVQL